MRRGAHGLYHLSARKYLARQLHAIPPTRRWLQARVRGRLQQQIKDGTVRVVTMHGFGGGPPSESGYPSGMDPTKGIVVDPEGPDSAQ